ncbi:dynein axonemal heavy chain 2 [Genypterus blacodes]|uniref:dynein axonemal heavy chain 2 n=1 Tax=Genypterus blacodes TaxID=154954 RepID=UPI003F75F7A0
MAMSISGPGVCLCQRGTAESTGLLLRQMAVEVEADSQTVWLNQTLQEIKNGGEGAQVSARFVPTATKIHDLFNLSDISKRGLFISSVTLPRVTKDSWTEGHEKALDQFIDHASITTMVVYLDPKRGLVVDFSMPLQVQGSEQHLTVFIRAAGMVITVETFDRAVQFFTVQGNSTQSMLRKLTCLHSPMVALNTAWEKSIRDHYTMNMHCYLAKLTDNVFKKVGNTVFYIPTEAMQQTAEQASKDKKLVQRLETVMIHWTDQIKEVMNAQEIMEMTTCGPLEEIHFWRSHSAKLLGVSQQLKNPEVKHIQTILQLSKSLYAQRFCNMTKEMEDGSLQAQSNLSFLSMLKEPCEELAQLPPSQVAPKLRHIISLIRIIWVNSPYYNSRERITALFHKMSNEIICLCLRSISLDRIFEGYVTSSRQILTDCIKCCQDWKDIYLRASFIHTKYSSTGWVLDQHSIFVRVDCFVQRFRELLELCDCQQQFVRWEDGQQRALPCFGGSKGPEITSRLLEIESIFNCNLQTLRSVDKDNLDIENNTWFKEFNRFCACVKDLEMMLKILINFAFDVTSTVEEGLRLLNIFKPMSQREAIKRTTDEKVDYVYNIFMKELEMVNKELNRRTRPSSGHMPLLAGESHWARALKNRIQRPMELLQKSPFMPETESCKNVVLAYSQTVLVLDEVVRRNFSEWNQGLEPEVFKRLEQPMMVRCKDNATRLDINFDNDLVKLFAELYYWDRLNFEIPINVSDIYQRREDFMGLRERALLLIRGYNRIIGALSSDELRLFRERIRFLDKKIQPGMTKLSWLSTGSSNLFITDCLLHIDKVQLMVDGYKESNVAISNLCCQISQTLLFKMVNKTVYRGLEFEEDQKAHQRSHLKILYSAHRDIIDIMTHIHKTFSNDGREVQECWVTYTEKVDHMVEEALRSNIKRSMLELSRAINGDSKTSPNPLFGVLVVLHQGAQQTSAKVESSPSLQKLAQIVNNIMPQLISTISGFKRVPEVLTSRSSQRNPLHINIEQDEEIRKIQAAVATGMTANAGRLQAYLKSWDKYREIWEMNKDTFIQRYQRLNPPVSSFDADIARYTEKANNVQQEETVLNIRFVTLDCSVLKSSLVQHCNEWQSKFTQLLSRMTSNRLKEIHAFMHDNANRLREVPQNLADLAESLNLLESLQGDLAKTEAQIPLIHEQFGILDKYEVTVEQTVQEMREVLNAEWLSFQQVLIDSDIMIKKHKEKFKSSSILSSEQLKKKTEDAVQEFNSTGPFDSALSTEAALKQIEMLFSQLETLKQEENTVLNGLVFFAIDHPPSKPIRNLEKDLQLLQHIWEITQEWNTNWNNWKAGQLATLQTDSMENTAQTILKELLKLQRELKDKKWDIVDFTKSKIDHFKRIIPLIVDLRNPAMRDRHWKQICHELRCSFDQTSSEFTLEKIISLGLDQHADRICEISAAASKELAIEQALEGIAKTWEQIYLDILPYKDQGHYMLRDTDEVFQALDDNQVVLSTMKASRFVKAFEQEVDHWERCLSQVQEVIEMILTIQRQWMYLENIFQGHDIKLQLPYECKEFDDVSSTWKTILGRLHKNNNALQGTHHPGLLNTLSQMSGKLEGIQKALELYLETKRQIFPRFYFLSSDDVLEILGQSQNPDAMQPHLKKCFDNIKSIEKVTRSTSDASGMFSADGEFIPFDQPLKLDRPVEVWLCALEKTMCSTLKTCLSNCHSALKKMKGQRDKWVKDWPGQMLITASQIQWTSDVTEALKDGKDKSTLKSLKKKQVSMLQSYSEAIRGNLSKVMRLKIVALVTVEVHARDVIDKLAKAGCSDINAFEWLCHLRLYWDKDVDDCIIRQTNTHFKYGYEYLGNSGRLVITPLTDRCYMTLTTALHLHRGGSPKGPAGTGKTETVKDLGKALGMYVIVVNCSEGLDYKSMGRMYSGLAQTGAWGCFDEFNRINIEVLSVVAQQILAILSALSARCTKFHFEGQDIQLVKSCGIFITMNPGYAGRSELPDNLKSMFRPISMVVPDSTLIAEIILFGEGFNNCKLLAKKVFTLYSLAVQQLSKQDHYDFGLRALTSLLRYSGKKRRACPNVPDEEVLLMSMKDMNIAKLTSTDLPLFNGIIQDLFPVTETPVIEYDRLKEAIEVSLRQSGLQVTPFTVTKVIQLYETKNSRHSCMLVGKTGSGKTVTWRTLQNALTALHHKGEPGFQLVQTFPLNPKAMTLGELYGENNLLTNEWTDGVLSSLIRSACADEKPDEKWIVFDGPVDTLWIESMNSIMDDNKVLTLINGERISMPEQVSLLFEVEDLAMASPATVSRCGMVYNDYSDLGWKPFVQSWQDKRHKAEVDHLKRLFEKYIESTLNFKKSSCKELVPITEINGVTSLCRLYDSLATPSNGVNISDTENLGRLVELWFIFCLIWSICASVDEDGRKKMDKFLREMEGTFPIKDTIYEYNVDSRNKTWISFEDKLPKGWCFPSNAPFYQIMVPTVDTVRYNFLVKALVSSQYPVLLTGPVGTGKTSVAHGVLQGMDNSKWTVLTVNMSSQTTSDNMQVIMESRLEKRTKGVFMPTGGKHLLCFLDDLNMPAHDQFGSQPPLELLRLWIDYGFWYDRQKQHLKFVKDMFLLASMGPPGGGRNDISCRLQNRFNLINMTFPNDSQIRRIYSTMMNQKLRDFREELSPIGETLTQATLELYYAITARFLPTPAKIHYLFNLRDISKVFQGLLRAHPDFHDTKNSLIRLWIHECFRVFSDRLIGQSDMDAFVSLLAEKLGSLFDLTYHSICPNKQPPLFGDFLREPRVYEDLTDMKSLKSFMETHLEDYNLTPGVVPMSLVLFRDAIEHVIRVVRVISQPRGNMLLVGVGGSGRQSLSRMAASICEYQIFQVEVTKVYRKQEFREDIKKLYRLTGVDNKPTVFLFSDTHIVDESFLEEINNILSSGEVPNLYKQDEFVEVCSALSDSARRDGVIETPDSMFSYLIERVRNNLHVVLCMSPVGESFRNRILQYPALVNCTTIDWFCEWPRDALLEVSERFLDGLDLGSLEGIQSKVASIFVTIHQSVVQSSQRMKMELRRHNYVTSTNYLELVSGYKKLLAEKRSELGEQVNKLSNGIFKITDTREKVEAMSVELEEAKKQVADFQTQCDKYLADIVQQKKEADKQQPAVSARSEKIAAEELECKAMAENAQRDLDEALPALEEAMKALESLNKKDMTEIKSYGRPPALVETVMQAVMILLRKEPTWAEAKRQLGESNFIKTLVNFDKDNISDRVLKKIGQYCKQVDFQPEIVGKVSLAAKSLCMWVRAMEVYGRIYRVVEPKRLQLQAASSQLAEKQAALAEAQSKLQEVGEKLEMLKKQHNDKMAMKESLRKKSEDMEVKLDRAGKLVTGLAGERLRWEERVAGLEENIGYLVGDCLLAVSFLSYMGPFLSNYRDELLAIWMKAVRELEVLCSPGFSFSVFLSKPTAVRDWNIQGLPSDTFSTENGIIVMRGNRWPLMVDPQGQALKWIKNMEMNRGLKVIDFQMPDYLRVLENAIQFGNPVLLQNIKEELEPSLNPILNKSLTRIGSRLLLKLGDKEVEYSPEFRLYIATNLSNPHYTPEISTKTTIVNFALKEQGLEAQLLGIVVRKERPELEEQRDSLVTSIASGKRSLQDLEDQILSLLNESTGSLLDDVQLVNTLQTSKVTASEVSEQLENSEQTEIMINSAREAYRPCAQRASILFFVLNDMSLIDPMYQFSLDAYIILFNLSIEKSKHSNKLEERITSLNDYHTYAVYRYTCRGLFEVHKLLFSFQMCAKIMEVAGKLNMDEYSFFLRGGIVLNKEGQMDNPCPGWLADSSWDNITELNKLPNFQGIMTSFEQYPRDWNRWYTSAEPENVVLPGEWGTICNELQKMLIVRSLRQDRVPFCVTTFIVKNLGLRFVEPPVLDMEAVLEESSCRTPLIFVLSPGVDPTGSLVQVAESSGMSSNYHSLSLGQGQAPIAKCMIEEGVKKGHWVFLANCHLSLSWMPELDKLVEQLRVQEPHPNFRLWLSSSPNPEFPITILQAGIKMTTEPPKGVKANMKRLYQLVTESQFNRCSKPIYRKLLFSLCFFHSILLERKKFLQLGWNIVYAFNDSDFEVSENLLRLYLDEYMEIPWDTLKYLIAGVNYGGHVTDDWDRRLLTTYITDYFCDATVTEPFFKLSSLPTYYIPRDGPQSTYKEFISLLPSTEHPEVFGQHPNADIASQIAETRMLFDTLLSLRPQVTNPSAAGAGASQEDKVLELSADVRGNIPALIDYEGIRTLLHDDPSPLNVVLLQEIQRYNALLHTIISSLSELEKAIKGIVVMSASLEETFHCIYDARVPPLWEKAYPSLKPLASWTRDLCQRVDQFAKWAETGHAPKLFWLSGFTFPNSFLTAVLQSSARQHNISVDTLSWEFLVSTVDDSHLLSPPKDGVFIQGLYLEGAGWDKKNSCLVEAEPMQMVCPIPTIHFKPVENRKKMSKSMYLCPCYYFPVRSGRAGRASFVVAVELKSGAVTPDHWIKRGTALLMSLDN